LIRAGQLCCTGLSGDARRQWIAVCWSGLAVSAGGSGTGWPARTDRSCRPVMTTSRAERGRDRPCRATTLGPVRRLGRRPSAAGSPGHTSPVRRPPDPVSSCRSWSRTRPGTGSGWPPPGATPAAGV